MTKSGDLKCQHIFHSALFYWTPVGNFSLKVKILHNFLNNCYLLCSFELIYLIHSLSTVVILTMIKPMIKAGLQTFVFSSPELKVQLQSFSDHLLTSVMPWAVIVYITKNSELCISLIIVLTLIFLLTIRNAFIYLNGV